MRARFVLEHAANAMDKYYAPDYLIEELIKRTIENVPMDQITEIIEPAAGDGALIPYIEELSDQYGVETKYYDLNPDIPEIETQDFLICQPSPYFSESRLVITGPPYADNLWPQFAKKAAEIAGYVAFISPHTWLDVKHPVPHLELISQTDMGTVIFRGSKFFGGKPHPVKTAILIYKRIDDTMSSSDDINDISDDFEISIFERYKHQGKKNWEYYISGWGSNAGEVSTDGISKKGTPFSRAVVINVKNEDKREDLERFLETFEQKYKPLIQKYSATTRNIIHLRRFKEFLRDGLYEINEALDFEREGSPYEKLRIGKDRFRPYPQMSPDEFQQWFESEIKPYYESELGFDMVLDNLINNDLESDEELAAYWKGEIPDEAIKKLIPMRDYFMDFRYSSRFGY